MSDFDQRRQKIVNQYNTYINGISAEEFKALSEELGITQNALRNFLKILDEQVVPYQNYDHTLRLIAERYLPT